MSVSDNNSENNSPDNSENNEKNILFYIIGHNGWIGKMFTDYCIELGIEVTYSDFRGESDELLDDIIEKDPSHVLCCTGRTHGTLNGVNYTTIDYLQHNETLAQNINDNLFVPLKLANFCDKNDIHFTYLGTGCIYSYSENHPEPFAETDAPNFFGSNYSIVKGFTNNLMNETNSLHLRIRMPITSKDNPRNFITKITNYKKICSIKNSMTVLDELIPIAVHMMLENVIGPFNLTNPGVIEHNDILAMYKTIVNPEFKWENFTVEEQNEILLSKRSNNHLSTERLENIYNVLLKPNYDYLELNNIRDAVNMTLKKYTF